MIRFMLLGHSCVQQQRDYACPRSEIQHRFSTLNLGKSGQQYCIHTKTEPASVLNQDETVSFKVNQLFLPF